MWDRLYVHARIATMVPGERPYGTIEPAALATREGRIAWIGSMDELPRQPAREVCDAEGRWITPGLIDCHTHLIFAGDRGREFELRLEGRSYAEIAAAGGGILSTVRATRAASEEELFAGALGRLRRLCAEGVTTIEIKSGYGLELESELRMLRVARRLGAATGVRVVTTLLAAHAVPPEYAGRADDYIDHLVRHILPRAREEGLADAVDAFLEEIAFSPRQCARLFEAAQRLGIPVRLHADQLSDGGGAALAASFRALSADHLEFASEAGIAAMAEAGTIAVLLPGAWLDLGGGRKPPVALFRRHRVPMALASDCNPGSSPVLSLLAMLHLGCVAFGLTPEEALAGVTRHAAAALGLGAEIGTLEVGKVADLLLWEIGHPRDLCYWLGAAQPVAVLQGGVPVATAAAAHSRCHSRRRSSSEAR